MDENGTRLKELKMKLSLIITKDELIRLQGKIEQRKIKVEEVNCRTKKKKVKI